MNNEGQNDYLKDQEKPDEDNQPKRWFIKLTKRKDTTYIIEGNPPASRWPVPRWLKKLRPASTQQETGAPSNSEEEA